MTHQPALLDALLDLIGHTRFVGLNFDIHYAHLEDAVKAAADASGIVTQHVYPPIPSRSHDWCAHYDGDEEAGGYGYGATEAEAILDFFDNCQADHDARRAAIRSPQPSPTAGA